MSSSSPKTRSLVCHRCASIKQGCTGGFSCERCVRLGLPCQPKSGTSPIHLDNLSSMEQPQPRARIQRVHTGCVTCKKRKKKCDETKPSCGNCRRLCLSCSWAPNRFADRSASLVDMGSSGWLAEQWSFDDGVVEEQVRASQDFSTSAPSTDGGLDASIADLLCQLSGVQGPSPVDTSSTATYDISSWTLSPNTQELNILPQSPSALSASSPSPADAGDILSLTLHRPSTMPDMTSPLDKALLNHYSTVVTSVLARCPNPSSNPYLVHLLPMAMSNPIVLHSVLALSATHWQRLFPEMEDRAVLHRGKATQALATLLPHIDASTIDIALVSCLLLCMTELFDGSSTGWTLHLQGAKRLFATLCEKKRAGRHVRFLVKLARFLDSAATTSTCKPPLIEKQQDIGVFDFEGVLPGEDAAIYGIPKELFHLVDRVNDLASKRGTRVDEASECAFRQQASAIREQLDNWALDFGGLSGAVASLGLQAGDDVLHATTAYESALRLRHHQVTEGYSLADERVSECVGRIVEAAQKIRYGSPLETCLLFPLVMAGGACEQLEDRMVIHDRLMVMEKTCGFGYIHQSRELVEKVWRRREAARESRVNWARIRYEEMGGLAVF